MDNQGKSDLNNTVKRLKTSSRKSRISHELTTEKTKLLEYMFDTLCSVRMTAKSYDYGFLSYLVEMAALEVQKEIKQEKRDRQPMTEVFDERNAVPDAPLKASR